MNGIRERIAKLLALGENNTNEAEAAAALAKASALMMAHGISRADLGNVEELVEGEHFESGHEHLDILGRAAGILYGCKPLHTAGWEAFRFIGRADNVQAASDTYEFMREQLEALYKAFLPRGLTKRERADFRKQFKRACAGRVYVRCEDIVREQCTPSESNSSALVVLDHRRQLVAQVEEHFAARGAKTAQSRALFKPHTSGFVAGHVAGSQVELHKNVKSQ